MDRLAGVRMRQAAPETNIAVRVRLVLDVRKLERYERKKNELGRLHGV
jgi:hypothetical protein